MSEKSSEIALQQIDALNRGDLEAFVDLVSPDVEWEDAIFGSEPVRIYRGKAELRQWLNRVLEPWESFHLGVEEIREAADDRVLVGGVLTTRGKGSGAETQIRGCFVFWIANGNITRRQVFLDRAEALEAAGLAE